MKINSNPFLKRLTKAALLIPMTVPAIADTAIPQGLENIDTAGNPALGVITRDPGGIAWFNTAGTATATGTTLSNGIIGPWAFIGTGTNTRYATLDGSNNVVAYTGYTGVAYNLIPNGGTGTVNYRITSAGSVAYGTGSRNINSLTSTTGATTLTWGNGASQINLITNGIVNAGSGTLTLTHGGSHANSGIMIGANNGRELVVSAASANISLGRIIDNTGGASSLTISNLDSNTVTLASASTYSGGTRVISGTLISSASGALGSGAILVDAAASMITNASQTISQSVTGAGAISNNGGTLTVSGDFSGFTGTFTHNSSVNSSVATTTAALSADAAYHIATTQGSGQGIVLDLRTGTNTFEMGALSGVANSLVRNGLSVAGTNTLRVGNLNTDTEFAGILGGGGGTIALEKVGDGTLTLSGTNAYNGATKVSVGKLIINGNISTSNLTTVNNGAALAGNGTVGAATVNGFHDAGSTAIGVQSFSGNLAYGATSLFEWDLAGSATGSRNAVYDGVNVDGSLTGSTGATFRVNLNSGSFGDNFWDINRTWNDIFMAGVDGSGSALNIQSVFSAVQWYVGTTNMTSLTGTEGYFTLSGSSLNWTAVPEPSASALTALLLTAGLLRRRRA